jgi:2-hydroxychromene-2-carboxylate isomerase
MRVVLQFFVEVASTYTYLAASRIGALATGVEVRWRPFLLGPIFASQGWNNSPFELFPVKGRYMWHDVAREAAALGLPFRRPSVFPRNGTAAAKLAFVGLDEGWGEAFLVRVLRANFAEDRDIADASVLDELLADVGAREARARLPEFAGELRRNTEEAAKLGVFGAPTFVVGDELFWGNDRLERAIAAARYSQLPAV